VGASYLRIYLGQMQNQPWKIRLRRFWRRRAGRGSVSGEDLLEMHDALKTGAQARSLIRAAGNPENLGVIFDTVLPFRQQEDPFSAWQAVADSVGALHIRAAGSDARGENHQVLPEDSRYPLDALLKTLLQAQFDGPWVILWERIFDPTLCPMPKAIGAYRRAIARCMQGLG
jgi:sugar phosphate isomerase/epimerase